MRCTLFGFQPGVLFHFSFIRARPVITGWIFWGRDHARAATTLGISGRQYEYYYWYSSTGLIAVGFCIASLLGAMVFLNFLTVPQEVSPAFV